MKYLIKILVLLMVIPTTSCDAVTDMVLERKDTGLFSVKELNGKAPYKLIISGSIFHSSLVVNEIRTKIQGSSLTVFVHLVLTKPGYSGTFVYELEVPESVSEVRFGNGGTVIWESPLRIIE